MQHRIRFSKNKPTRYLLAIWALAIGFSQNSCRQEQASLKDQRLKWAIHSIKRIDKKVRPDWRKETIQVEQDVEEILSINNGNIWVIPSTESLSPKVLRRILAKQNLGQRVLWLGAKCFSTLNRAPYVSRMSPAVQRGQINQATALELTRSTALTEQSTQPTQYTLSTARALEGATQGRLGGNGNSRVNQRDIIIMNAVNTAGERKGKLPVATIHLRKGNAKEGGEPMQWGWLALDEGAELKRGEESKAWRHGFQELVALLSEEVLLLGAGPTYQSNDPTPKLQVLRHQAKNYLPKNPQSKKVTTYQLQSIDNPQFKTIKRMLDVAASTIALPSNLPAGEYQLQVSLSDQHPAASIISRFYVGSNQQPQHPPLEKLQIKNGKFMRGSEPFPLAGVNYWSLSSVHAGSEQFRQPSGWLNPANYDPVETERDLSVLASVGINAVSIQIRSIRDSIALQDFLERCRKHRIYVHAYLPRLFGIGRNFSIAEKIIKNSDLPKHEHVFAYDIAWEAHAGSSKRRNELLGAAWKNWIKLRYGNVRQAERAMSYPINLDNWGEPMLPTDQQLSQDGDHRHVVLPFRNFFSEWISMHYGECKRFLRSLGLEGAIGARSGLGGTGNPWSDTLLPVDLQDGVRHFDYIAPELWHLDQQNIAQASYLAAYANYVGNNKKPILWAEFGEDLFQYTDPPEKELPETAPLKRKVKLPDEGVFSHRIRWLNKKKTSKNYSNDPQSLTQAEEQQAAYYRDVVKMAQSTNSSALFAWWFPGGYRPSEQSNFSLYTHALTPRPALLELAKFSAAQKSENTPTEETSLTAPGPVDARGFSAWWLEQSNKPEQGSLNQAHKLQPYLPDLGDESPSPTTELTSDNTPLINASGLPMGENAEAQYDVPYYLKGELEQIELSTQQGKQIMPARYRGMNLTIDSQQETTITLVFGNNGGCRWIAAQEATHPIQVFLLEGNATTELGVLGNSVDQLETGRFSFPATKLSTTDEKIRFYLQCRGARFAFTPAIQTRAESTKPAKK